jgi:hypothetical protein
MIPMSELEIIKELTELIEEEYPEYLLITEEQMPDVGHLPPLRYVGTRQNLPQTMTGPHLLITLETAEPTVKDRIIKQTVYHLTLQLQGVPDEKTYYYLITLNGLLDNDSYQIDLVEFEKGTIELEVKRRKKTNLLQ